ncbi:N-acyl-D-amino-acid deacylase [Actinomadura madurae]|uniref:N-acyl-D-amino-acid deacylase n=1 Tax=Actinomadura madurae TaxID=1993 RepID=A0A1I5NB33_9ACTN|nr:D-aminoacylase [Actinomadura madurae]SFP18566.1 N-acyl-D-amino-acid deacylase [Actinomadura madurae]
MTDLLIAGGKVVDGTGAAPRRADVAVAGGRVEAIGDLAERPAARTVDASGHVVSPGFVDVHTHSDLTLLSSPEARSAVRQGITTVVVGNCGLGVTPVADASRDHLEALRAAAGYLDLDPAVRWDWTDLPGYLDALGAARPAVNVAALVAHTPLRAAAAGFGDRPADAAALDRMRGLLGDALAAGAAGVSTGLVYAPVCYARDDELEALGRTAAAHGRLFAWHVRDYADGLLDSVRQALRVAAATGCRTQISHLVAVGRRNHGSVARALELIDAARDEGLDVAFDIYPYLAGNAPLSQLLPAWAQDGGEGAMRARLTDRTVRARIADEWRDMPNTWDQIAVGGRALTDLAADAGTEPPQVALDLVAEHGNGVQMVAGGRGERDLLDALTHPAGVIGSDGQALDPDGPTGSGTPHPRSYGCYPRLFAEYVRGAGGRPAADRLGLAEAVRKCTSAPAERAGLAGRGVLRAGAAADIVVFDPAGIADRATFAAPQQYPDGIRAVVVNGRAVVEDGAHRGARPGEILRTP